MAGLNRVVLVGNLTRDPELRATPSGASVASFGMAVNRRPNQQGERGVDYFKIVVWGKLAELCSEYLRKGRAVAIDGRLQSRSWETQDGQKRSTVEVVAENVQFLGPPTAREEVTEKTSESLEGDEAKGASQEKGQVDFDEEVPF